MAKYRAINQLKKIDVDEISLVDAAANDRVFVYKAAGSKNIHSPKSGQTYTKRSAATIQKGSVFAEFLAAKMESLWINARDIAAKTSLTEDAVLALLSGADIEISEEDVSSLAICLGLTADDLKVMLTAEAVADPDQAATPTPSPATGETDPGASVSDGAETPGSSQAAGPEATAETEAAAAEVIEAVADAVEAMVETVSAQDEEDPKRVAEAMDAAAEIVETAIEAVAQVGG